MTENWYAPEGEVAEHVGGHEVRVSITPAIICLYLLALLELPGYLPGKVLPAAGDFHKASQEDFIERAHALARIPAGIPALRHISRLRQQRRNEVDRAFVPGHMDGKTPEPSPPRAGKNEVHVSSLEAWPAAGGGLLLGVIVPALSGRAPRRHTVKTLFLRIGPNDFPTVIVPYVPLEREVLTCAAEIVAAELGTDVMHVVVDNNIPSSRSGAIARLADLCPASELNLMVLGAVARGFLTTAAAKLGEVLLEKERVGTPTLSAAYGELVRDAALLGLPRFVTLRSGRRVRLEVDDVTTHSAEHNM